MVTDIKSSDSSSEGAALLLSDEAQADRNRPNRTVITTIYATNERCFKEGPFLE
jgi:hypothetical protein